MINNTLIEKALSITWKSMEDMEVWRERIHDNIWKNWVFSIEKFCYYLLSPEFLEKYSEILDKNWHKWDLKVSSIWYGADAIHEYQSWNEKPLITLLEKIWAK